MPEQIARDRYWARVAQLAGDECVAYTTEESAAFVDGRLRPDEARAIEAHLATCAECRWLVEQLRQETAADTTTTAPAVRLRPRVPLFGSPVRVSAAVAAVFALALCLHLVRSGVGPAPQQTGPGEVTIAHSGSPASTAPVVPDAATRPEPAVAPPQPSAGPAVAPPVAAPSAPAPATSRRAPAPSPVPSVRRPPSRRPVAAPREMIARRPPAAVPPQPAVQPPGVLEGPADSYSPAPPLMRVPDPGRGVLALQGGEAKTTYRAPESAPVPQAVNPIDRSPAAAVHAESIKDRMFAPLREQAAVSRTHGED